MPVRQLAALEAIEENQPVAGGNSVPLSTFPSNGSSLPDPTLRLDATSHLRASGARRRNRRQADGESKSQSQQENDLLPQSVAGVDSGPLLSISADSRNEPPSHWHARERGRLEIERRRIWAERDAAAADDAPPMAPIVPRVPATHQPAVVQPLVGVMARYAQEQNRDRLRNERRQMIEGQHTSLCSKITKVAFGTLVGATVGYFSYRIPHNILKINSVSSINQGLVYPVGFLAVSSESTFTKQIIFLSAIITTSIGLSIMMGNGKNALIPLACDGLALNGNLFLDHITGNKNISRIIYTAGIAVNIAKKCFLLI